MKPRLEHANLAVRDIDVMIRFLTTAFPDFRIRRDDRTRPQGRWVHVGTDDTYIALNQATDSAGECWVPYAGRPGVNHLGYEVENLEALRERMAAAGYRESTVPNAHPYRRRAYFYDPEGNDWEFVEYYTREHEKRNDYELADPASG